MAVQVSPESQVLRVAGKARRMGECRMYTPLLLTETSKVYFVLYSPGLGSKNNVTVLRKDSTDSECVHQLILTACPKFPIPT